MLIDFNREKYFKILVIVLAITILMGGWVFVEGRNNQFLEIDFYDVGQGDAIFIETPQGKQILIDGGPSSLVLEKLGKELPFWDRHIDLIVLTHPEYDHMSGLIEVIKRYERGGILATGVVRETAEYKEWRRVIEVENIPIYIAQAGGIIKIDSDTELFILHPTDNLKGQKIKQANNSSIVAKLVYKNFGLLLTGDIEKKIEKALVNSRTDLRADVLKVAHHGSKTSTTEDFLRAVNPSIAVIQAGKDNSYGHPHYSVLERLKNIAVFSTTEHDDIEILTNGLNFWVKPR
jgi:competence protein ComEC